MNNLQDTKKVGLQHLCLDQGSKLQGLKGFHKPDYVFLILKLGMVFEVDSSVHGATMPRYKSGSQQLWRLLW